MAVPITFQICARFARPATTVGTAGGGRGVKSPRLLGCDRPGGTRSFPQNSETFFALPEGGVGGGGYEQGPKQWPSLMPCVWSRGRWVVSSHRLATRGRTALLRLPKSLAASARSDFPILFLSVWKETSLQVTAGSRPLAS